MSSPVLAVAAMSAPGFGGVRRSVTIEDLRRTTGVSQAQIAMAMNDAVGQGLVERVGSRLMPTAWAATEKLDGEVKRGLWGDPKKIEVDRAAMCGYCGGYLDAEGVTHRKEGCFKGQPWVCEECGVRLPAPVVICDRHEEPGKAVLLKDSRFDVPTPKPPAWLESRGR